LEAVGVIWNGGAGWLAGQQWPATVVVISNPLPRHADAKRPHDHTSVHVGNSDITVTAQAISNLIICITHSSSEQSAEYA
jgi:hypothetical protein